MIGFIIVVLGGDGAQRTEFIRTETTPMRPVGFHYRHLTVAERQDMFPRLLIAGDIDLAVGHAIVIQRAAGGVALRAVRFTVNTNSHDSYYLFWRKRGDSVLFKNLYLMRRSGQFRYKY